jgi:vacuolar-type H+-ATPase subunit C/Vma6
MRRPRHAAADLPYLCARLHARLVPLLTAAEFERLRGQPSLGAMLACLLDTDGRPELLQAVLDAGDIAEFAAGLTAVLARRVNSVQQLVADSVPAYLDLVSGPWDLQHVRALCRRVVSRRDLPGLPEAPRATTSSETSALEATGEGSDVRFVRDVFVPVGSLDEATFRRAAGAESLEDLGTRLEDRLPALAGDFRAWLQARRRAETPSRRVTGGSAVVPGRAGGAGGRRGSIGESPGPRPALSLREVELFLENWHLGRLRSCVRAAVQREDAVQLRRFVALQLDLANVRTGLRFLGSPLAAESAAEAYVAGGTLSPGQFAGLMSAAGIQGICHHAPPGPLTAALEKGSLPFAGSGRPVVFERAFDEQLLLALRRWGRLQPISVAWLLYYLARARNEWVNLQAIARGIRYRLPAGKVQGSLVYA